MRSLFFTLTFIAMFMLFVGCSKTSPTKAEQVKESPAYFSKAFFGTETLLVEIADTDELRAKGLMYRREMPQNQGMLFIFPEPQPLVFWMHNTFLPLDIAFVSADGTILNILQMAPLDDTKRYRSEGFAKYAIETNINWFSAHKIVAGSKVTFELKPKPLIY